MSMTRHDPKLFEKIRLAVSSLPNYGLICNDRHNPMLSRHEVIAAIDKIERDDRMQERP